MSGYDPKVQQDLADLLITRAKRITLIYAAMAAIVGAGIGQMISISFPGHRTLQIFLATLLMAIFGFVFGKERSGKLKQQAQELLWQKQVEENTRGNAAGMAATTGK